MPLPLGVPDKIDVKIGSKEEKEWSVIVEREEEALIKHRINVEITENLLILAKKRVKEEHDKFNKKQKHLYIRLTEQF